MKCKYCGALLSEGELICPECGREVRIVPDYNPLDDVLAAKVREHLEEHEQSVNPNRQKRKGNSGSGRTSGGTRAMNAAAERERAERARRAARLKKEQEMKRKKMIMAIVAAVIVLGLCVIIGVTASQNSYGGLIKKGEKALTAGDYNLAADCFERAIDKEPKKEEAYDALIKVYTSKKDNDGAEAKLRELIAKDKSNVVPYEKLIGFFVSTDQGSKIPLFLTEVTDEKVNSQLDKYRVDPPEFSLPANVEYDDVQSLEITAKEGDIYYTVDGSDPTNHSTKYEGKIKIDEGTVEIRAIAVKDGVPSVISSNKYTVEFPIEDAPIVTPTTGQYNSVQYITVTVPENYEAYYTLDGSVPDPVNKKTTYKYTEPIELPEGNTIFSVVLVNQRGKMSEVTKRSYELVYSD